MMRYLHIFLVFSQLFCGSEYDIHFQSEDTIFISLGSYCEVASTLKELELRNAAYPFDFIISFDGKRLIEILNDDFTHFLNRSFLSIAPKGPGYLLNNYYHLEFLHEGDFRQVGIMDDFQSKYERRINRFRNLVNYSGKVIFIRVTNEHSLTDPHRHFFCADNLEITDEYSYELYDTLKNRFPHLNFSLILLNRGTNRDITIEKQLSENMIKVRYDTNAPMETKKTFFFSLL